MIISADHLSDSIGSFDGDHFAKELPNQSFNKLIDCMIVRIKL